MSPTLDESRIDDEGAIAVLDSKATLRALATAGAQVRTARVLAHEAGIARVNRGDRPRTVLVASLGGAAVVADVLGLLAQPGSPIAVTTRQNLPLPGWVGPLDLVVAVSQSGRARGPLALAAEAARRGAGLLTVGAADSPLADVCAQARGIHVDPHGGDLTSRTALWALLTPVLMGASALDVIALPDEVLDEVADRLDVQADACRPSSESFVNPAKVLAIDLAETLPVVLGDGPLTGVVACRTASMLARTSRMPATWGELPDAAAQVVACLDGPFAAGSGSVAGSAGERDIFADPYLDGPQSARLGLLVVRDVLPEAFTPEDAARHNLAQAVVESARESGATVWELTAEPGHDLVRLAGLIALTDFTSTYLALGLGLDPSVSLRVAALRDRTP